MSNWKAPGPDKLEGFWFKRITDLHKTIVKHLQFCLAIGKVPAWIRQGQTVLIIKERNQR